MREHNHRLEVRLNDREYRKLKASAARSGLSISSVIRKMIDEKPIAEHPPIDYWNAYRSIEACRQKLHSEEMFNYQCRNCTACREALMECKKIWEEFHNAFYDPSYFQTVNINENNKEE